MQLFPFVLRAALAFAPPVHGQPVAIPADEGALEVARFDGDVVARVLIRSPQDLMLVNHLSGDMWSHCASVGGEADFRLSQSGLDTLGKVGVPYRILIPDLQERIDAEQVRLAQPEEAADWFADFKNLAAVNARLDALVAAHPDIATIVTAGTSIQGRTIRGLRISRYPAGTNLPGFIFTGTAHAREWASTMTAMWIADQMIEQDGIDSHSTAILNSAEIFIFPVQNPDGYEYTWGPNRLWRKNRRLVTGSTYGVDMNRNWSVGWGGAGSSASPSNETYRGTAAFSEPETAGMRDFMQARANLCGFIDFHSYGQEWLWSWSYINTISPDEAAFQTVGFAMQTALGLNGFSYAAGRSYALYGAVAGCIDDWGYGVMGMVSGTLEVRDLGSYGFVMPASAILPNARENYAAATAMMEKLLASCPVSITLGPGSTVAENTPATVEALAVPNISSLIANGVRLKWSVDGGVTQSAVMTSIGSNKYRATLPGIACGSQLTWFVEAETKFIVTRAPLNMPTSFNVTATDPCGNPADLDGDGFVDGADLGLMLLDFGVCPVPSNCPADLDGSGEVDSGDVGLLLLEYN